MKYKTMIIKDKKKADAVIRCLRIIEKSIVRQSDGKFGISVSTDYKFVQEILNVYFPLPHNAMWISETSKRGIISSAIMRWIKYKKFTSDAAKVYFFQKAVETEVRKAQNRISKFNVLMFVNVNISTIKDFEGVKLLENNLHFVSWEAIEKLDIKSLWHEVYINDQNNAIIDKDLSVHNPVPDIGKFSPLICEVITDLSDNALEIADDRLNLFRCFLNLPSTLGTYFYYRSRPRALAKILPSPIYAVFNENGKRIRTSLTIEKYDYKKEAIKENQKDAIQYMFSMYSSYPARNDLKEHILNILRLYQRALDTTLTESAYLAMWQVLENSVSLGDKSLDNQIIKSRIKFLAQLDDLSSDMVDILTEKRNELVHLGKYSSDGDSLFHNLKLLTEATINKLISYSEKFSTVMELKDYVTFNSLGSDDLERKKKIIERILAEHQKR